MKLFSRTDIDFDIERKQTRGILSEIHMADIHFGAIDPKTEYEILKKEVISCLYRLSVIDIIFINGDLFERKYTTDSEQVRYASLFMADIRSLAISKNATVVILSGTEYHDAGQLNLFYHYLEDPEFDIRIVENIRFEYIKGAKILCIPELYGIPEDVYQNFLFKYGIYDQCVMHGTIEGAVYGNTINKRGRLFGIDDFANCRGPIIAGHVHVPGCFNSHFYYSGSPIRYKFGEEEPKGVLLVYYNLDNGFYYPHLIPVISFRYDTINIDELISQDPKDIIEYINNLKEKEGIDYLRIVFSKEVPSDNLAIIKEYYKNNGRIRFKLEENKDSIISSNTKQESEVFDNYSYLFDDTLSPYEKLAFYINQQEGSIMVSGDQIKKIIEGETDL